MDYRIIWGTNDDRPPTDAVGSGRGAIEALLERAGAKVVWAEVFDDHRRPVAHKSPGRQGLRGFPSAAGWGHVCTACRTLSGQTYLFARAHPGLRLPRDEGGAMSLCAAIAVQAWAWKTLQGRLRRCGPSCVGRT